MQDIKAIETEYNGYRFRSRLEARWAVFFDAAGVKYQYEPEGFEVKVNDNEIYRYLPDFYLPDFNVWVEIKPNKQKLLEDAEKITSCIDFGSTPISESNGLLILGQIPNYDPYEKDNIPAFNLLWWEKGVCSELAEFIIGDNGKAVLIFEKNFPYSISTAPYMPDLLSNDDLLYYKRGIGMVYNGLWWNLSTSAQLACSEELLKLYDKARSARFEFGERG